MKFFWQKTKTVPVDFAELRTDMHSHLIPGIDDGVIDLNAAVEAVRGLQQLGYRKLITTPHIISDMYRNSPDTIQKGLLQVQEAVTKAGIDVELKAAAEYFLDDHVMTLLEQDKPLLTIHKNWVLVEFSMVSAPFNMDELLFNLTIKGYTPVIAHPERYPYLQSRPQQMESWKNSGFLLQGNILSLAGHYGKRIQDQALGYLENGFYDLMGSDTHSQKHINALGAMRLTEKMQQQWMALQLKNNLL